ncbi:hypothetical protein NFC81_15260 [Salinispirillum sp. LH 10-3-1]|uniref:Uncharacterized protein n=1 Tax=Salinispirillum sp. LH 10-3-1 TaxID=2952525 RepID=A0AB38YFG6_9GAMM
MMDHYYGAFAGIAKEGTERLRAQDAQHSGRVLEGAEHSAAVEKLRGSANSKRSGVVVTIAPPEPPPEPKPTVLNFKPQPGVMVRQDIPSIAANPDLDLRRTMVEAKVNDQPVNSSGSLESLLELGAKRDINLSQSLALLGAYDGDVESLTLRSRVEMGDVHGMEVFSDEGIVYRDSTTLSRYYHMPEISFSLQTVDGGTINIKLSIDEFINEATGYSGHEDPRTGMSRSLTFTMETQGDISQAAWEGLAPIMESLDAMINSFNTDQALRQSDVDAFINQIEVNQSLYSSSDLRFKLNTTHDGVLRDIGITTDQVNPSRITVNEVAMASFYQSAVSLGAHTMQRAIGDFDREAFAQLSPHNPEAFYLSAIASDWDTGYENLIRFMHSFLEE